MKMMMREDGHKVKYKGGLGNANAALFPSVLDLKELNL